MMNPSEEHGKELLTIWADTFVLKKETREEKWTGKEATKGDEA